MSAPARELRRPLRLNAVGKRFLLWAERSLSPAGLHTLRELLWGFHIYVFVTPGPLLIEQALRIFPEPVRALGARCPFYRYDARAGGGYWPDRNEVWLAAGVETYEGTAQVVMSARHELFHFIAHDHPLYRPDDDAGWPALWGALEASRAQVDGSPRYRDWVRRSFLPQGDHANPAELFADIPTNFPDLREIPAPLRVYFAPLLGAGDGGPAAVASRAPGDLAAFHAMIA